MFWGPGRAPGRSDFDSASARQHHRQPARFPLPGSRGARQFHCQQPADWFDRIALPSLPLQAAVECAHDPRQTPTAAKLAPPHAATLKLRY
jgi:hypothetical protein